VCVCVYKGVCVGAVCVCVRVCVQCVVCVCAEHTNPVVIHRIYQKQKANWHLATVARRQARCMCYVACVRKTIKVVTSSGMLLN